MRLLIDSHVLMWARRDSALLSPAAKAALGDSDNLVFWSLASAWELGLKIAAGRLEYPEDLEISADLLGAAILPITMVHVRAMRALPDHHRDPFDRMLVAQAIVEGLTFVTRDRAIRAYPVATLW